MSSKLPSLSDLSLLAGLGLLTWGAGLIYGPLRWILPGLALIAYGILRERAKP